MSSTETNVNNLKINRGTYDTIQENLSSIGENELIITTDKQVPIPTASDSGKVISVDSDGEYVLQTPSSSSGGYKYTYDLVIYTPFYFIFGGGPDSTPLHYIFKTNATASAIETGLLETINSVLSTSFTELDTVLISLTQMGLTNAQIFSQLIFMLSVYHFKSAAKIGSLGFEFINMYLEVGDKEGHSNILAVYDRGEDIHTAIIYGRVLVDNAYDNRIMDLYDWANDGGSFGEIFLTEI